MRTNAKIESIGNHLSFLRSRKASQKNDTDFFGKIFHSLIIEFVLNGDSDGQKLLSTKEAISSDCRRFLEIKIRDIERTGFWCGGSKAKC
ncbi:hypothetical protein AMJ44_11440 [candidate division WOR-1 bacterium DG_54_3]|uniref:Uncharacterized protein n=1 Tax=candidate division WOR-1 bacterium DG_54_3 TaxID=1703775 RepID=A0A0S7XRA5_UNCSA|nr:MAG: hypothetical protein AMJ44_11440 [candidate division WOR-1 bacterium DG_54_3]